MMPVALVSRSSRPWIGGAMDTKERAIRNAIAAVKAGYVSRRSFIESMVGLGLTAPMATMLLAHHGVAMAEPATPAYKPTRRGGGGTLRLLWWQGPTLLNPHFAQGAKDQEASRISTSRWRPGTARATSCPSWRRRFPAMRTAGSRATA